MPLMMDGDIDMDDLFGDGSALSLPSRPPPSKELAQRIDELRGSGCCQTIAWSKWGSIASITPDGSVLEFRNLRCSPENGSWALSEPTTTPPLNSNVDGGPLKHICWSPTGSELAVIDAAGRVTILSIFSSLNKPTLSRHCQGDPADDLHGVVGCYWLNLAPYPANRPTILNGPAIKEGNRYRYEVGQAPILGPCHPNHSKSAFVCITTNGLLKVLWTQNNGKWFESHAELESVVSSDDLITHAAVCSDKTGTLLIAYATTSKQLCTVRALIDWGLPKTIEKVSPAQLPLNPTIRTRHLAITSWLHEVPEDILKASHMEPSMVQLTHLEFLPLCGNSNNTITPPTIITVRSHLPSSASHYNQDVHTTVDRWEIREKNQSIHPAFEQLSSRRNSVGSQPGNIALLKKLESLTVNKILLAISPMNLGKVLCFAYSDGSVEYRDRTTMAETFNDGDLDRVWHLSQIGFSYTEDEPCLQVALSPTYCSMVQLRNDGKIIWQQLKHIGDIGSSTEDGIYNAVVATFALSCSTAVMTIVNYDDLLATAHEHAKNSFAYDWLVELAQILKFHVDYSEETHHDVLVRNTTIQLCLSIQNSLGFKGEFRSRTFAGKFSWLVLQLRNIVVLVTMAANMKVPGLNNEKASPLEDPEVINALTGSVRWILDLIAWVTDTLLTLHTNLPPGMDLSNANNLSLPDLLAQLRSTNTVSLHLLLSSAVRGFLTAICRRLTHLDYIARKTIVHPSSSGSWLNSASNPQNGNAQTPNQTPNPQSAQSPPAVSPALRAAYLQIATLTNNTILRVKTFETLLSSLTTQIKSAYASYNPPLSGSSAAEKTRNIQEIKMLLGGSLPEAFKPVIVELFRKEGLLDAVRGEIEPAKLFFADFTMLEVDEDLVSVEKRKRSHVTMDSFRKGWLMNPKKSEKVVNGLNGTGDGSGGATGVPQSGGRQVARWRRCARCAAVMEDVLSHRQALQWMIMQQRRCFCSGYWNTLEPGQTFA